MYPHITCFGNRYGSYIQIQNKMYRKLFLTKFAAETATSTSYAAGLTTGNCCNSLIDYLVIDSYNTYYKKRGLKQLTYFSPHLQKGR